MLWLVKWPSINYDTYKLAHLQSALQLCFQDLNCFLHVAVKCSMGDCSQNKISPIKSATKPINLSRNCCNNCKNSIAACRRHKRAKTVDKLRAVRALDAFSRNSILDMNMIFKDLVVIFVFFSFCGLRNMIFLRVHSHIHPSSGYLRADKITIISKCTHH